MSGNCEVRTPAGRRFRAALALLGLVLVVLVPMAPANAATTITVSRGSVIGGESVSVTGTLGMRKARPVVLQRQSGTRWVNVTPSRSTSTGSFRFLYKPPTKVGTKTVIRVIAPRTKIAGKTYAQITTGGRSILTVAQKATMTIPSVVSQDAAFTITGKFTPARTAREVVLQKPVNGTWVKVGVSKFQSSTGAVTFPMVLKTQGSFQFRVTALAASGAPAVASASGTVTVSMPVPTGLSATPGNASAQVSWNAVTATGLTGYNVYQRTDPGDLAAGWTKVNTNPVVGTSLNVTGLTNGTTYYFSVTSVSAADESAFAPKVSAKPVLPADTTPPPPPTGVGATAGSGSALVAWTPPATGEPTGYKVYRSTTSSGPWTLLTTNPVAGSSYNATGLSNGTEYFFAVTSLDAAGNESAKSTPASATPQEEADQTPPPVPTNVLASAGSGTAHVTWNAVVAGDLLGYRVFQGASASGPWTELTSTPISATAYDVSGLTNGTQYFFTVASEDTSGNPSAKATAASATPAAPPAGWSAVSAGLQHTCAVGSNGTLWCWGLNRHGQLGNATGVETGNAYPTPARVGSATTWTSVSAGDDFTCGIQSPGTLWCWGRNKYGQIARAANADTELPNPAPVQVGTADTWTSVSAGGNSACATRSNGTVWCWGLNLDGQLGRAANVNTTTPNFDVVQVGALTTWSSVSTGADHACGRRTDSTVWCWGSNLKGQLGNATNSGAGAANATPLQVTGTTWTSVAAGDYVSCGTQTGGALKCWGRNDLGQLASAVDGADGAHPTPATVTGTTWATVSVGGGQVCGTKTDGTAWCWGKRDFGQAGSIGAPLVTPTKVGTATNWAYLDAGTGHDELNTGHTAGLTTAGTVLTWGSNFNGQLGRSGGDPSTVGTTNPNPTPGLVPIPAG